MECAEISRHGVPCREAAQTILRELGEWTGNRLLVVSGCLLGSPCRFDGRSKASADVMALVGELRRNGWRVRRICPECSARFGCPRSPCELVGDRVVNREGRDVTDALVRGVERTVDVASAAGVSLAILKSKSPSCGVYEVYDGTFTGQLVSGSGLCTRRFVDEGIIVIDEADVAAWFCTRRMV